LFIVVIQGVEVKRGLRLFITLIVRDAPDTKRSTRAKPGTPVGRHDLIY